MPGGTTEPGTPAGRDGAPRWVDWVPLDEVVFAEWNPKEHDEAGIGASIDTHGVGELPLLDERTGRLVAGHGRIIAQRQKRDRGENPPDGVVVGADGVWRAGIVRGWRSNSDAQARAYLAGSNHLTYKGGWNEAELAPFLRGIQEADAALLASTGFTVHDVAAIEAALAAGEAPDLDDLIRRAGEGGTGELWPRIAGFKAPPAVVEAWVALVASHEGHDWMAMADLLGVTVEPDAHHYDPAAEPPVDPGGDDPGAESVGAFADEGARG